MAPALPPKSAVRIADALMLPFSVLAESCCAPVRITAMGTMGAFSLAMALMYSMPSMLFAQDRMRVLSSPSVAHNAAERAAGKLLPEDRTDESAALYSADSAFNDSAIRTRTAASPHSEPKESESTIPVELSRLTPPTANLSA